MLEGSLSGGFVSILLLPVFSNDLDSVIAGWNDEMDVCMAATVGRPSRKHLFLTASGGQQFSSILLVFVRRARVSTNFLLLNSSLIAPETH